MARDNRADSKTWKIIAFAAALLVFTAAAILYAKSGEVSLPLIMNGFFLLVMGILIRRKEPPPGDGGPTSPGT